jgi:hypothetical protein
MEEKDIVKQLTLWGARRPKTEEAQLMLKAADAILRLRAQINYEKARAEVNDIAEAPV